MNTFLVMVIKMNELHHETNKLVDDFALALKEKLLAAQIKYGYADNWRTDTCWEDSRLSFMRYQLEQGDMLDLAAYAAFQWYHNEHA